MKRLICLSLALWLLAVPVLADVIWEPEDDFYTAHREACEYLGRSYYANGQAGFAMVFETPEAKAYAEPHLENGAVLYVSFTLEYEGGAWGVAELEDGRTGWVRMEALTPVYDQQSFREDHAGEIRAEARTLSVDGLALCCYDFPGGTWQWQGDPADTKGLEPLTFSELYTDAEGREWGYLGYWYGIRNAWICLTDPENPDLPAEDHTPELYPLAEDAEDVPPLEASGGISAELATAGAVVLVCGVTAVLLFRMRKRRR